MRIRLLLVGTIGCRPRRCRHCTAERVRCAERPGRHNGHQVRRQRRRGVCQLRDNHLRRIRECRSRWIVEGTGDVRGLCCDRPTDRPPDRGRPRRDTQRGVRSLEDQRATYGRHLHCPEFHFLHGGTGYRSTSPGRLQAASSSRTQARPCSAHRRHASPTKGAVWNGVRRPTAPLVTSRSRTWCSPPSVSRHRRR
jgi:hypothetical protein